MKRIVTLLLALAMAFALVACGEKKAPSADGEEGKKTLRVAMECAYAPYNWTQPTDANGAVKISGSSEYAYGYDVMIAKMITEKLGYDLEIVKLEWDAIIPAVQSGTVDIAICGQSTTPERREKVDFTEPYYYASIVTLVPKDSKYANATSVADLAGATAVSQYNTIWNDDCLPQIENAKLLPGMESAPAMLVALTSGRAEIVVTDHPTGLAATAAKPELKMLQFEGEKDFKVSEDDIKIGISMKKGNADLLAEINAILVEYTEDDFRAMLSEAVAVQPLSE